MENMHFPRIDDNTTLRTTRTPATEHQYVIILGKSHGGMRFSYAMIDPETNTIVPKLNTIVWSRLIDTVDFATCVFKNCLYVIGGIERSTGRICRQVNKYDPFLGRWRQCADLCRPRARLAAAAIYGKIFVFGGMTSSTSISDTCESYEPLMDEWREEEVRLPEPRKDHACAVKDNNAYILGGASPTEVSNRNIWVLCRLFPDPHSPEKCIYEWSSLQDPLQSEMGYRLSRHSVSVCNDRMFILGGVVHGKTSDGKTVIRQQSQVDVLRVHHTNGLDHASPMETSPVNLPQQHPESSETVETKMLIATSSVVESYKFRAPIPDFGIDADVEEATEREKAEEEKRREKESRKRQRKKKNRGKKVDMELEAAMIEAEEAQRRQEEQERKANEQKMERLRNRTSWKTTLCDLPRPRCAMGTTVLGNKIYVIGGHRAEDETGKHVTTVEYYHAKRNEWFEAFELSDEGDFSSVDCCVLTVPKYNKDFKAMKYSGCKWVMW